MLVMEKDGIEWVERKAIVEEWQRIEKYIALLKRLGKTYLMETYIDAKIEEIQGHVH